MKTAGRENPNHGVAWPHNRAHGAVGQNRSYSIQWAAKQEKFQPKGMCFFLTSTFIERSCRLLRCSFARWIGNKVIASRFKLSAPCSNMLDAHGRYRCRHCQQLVQKFRKVAVASLRPEQLVALFAFLIQELGAGALNSKEDVSWIVLCSVRYRGQRMA